MATKKKKRNVKKTKRKTQKRKVKKRAPVRATQAEVDRGTKLRQLGGDDKSSMALFEMLRGRTTAPTRGTEELISAFRLSPWLHAVVNKIALNMASIEWVVGVEVNARSRRTMSGTSFKRISNADMLFSRIKQARDSETFVEIPDHPMLDFLNAGAGFLLGVDVRKLTQIYLELKGESYWLIKRNNQGMPIAPWPIPPHWIDEYPTVAHPFFKIRVGGFRKNFPADDMVVMFDPDPSNPYSRGSGTGEALGQELDTDEYASEFVRSFFYNGAIPDALIIYEGAEEEEVDAVKERWDRQHRGPSRSHGVKFVNYKASVEILGQKFTDMEIIELRKFLRDTAVQVFGFPPEGLGIIENSNRATIEAAEWLIGKFVTLPRAMKMRDHLQTSIAPMFDERLIVSFVSPVPEDRNHRLKAMEAAPWAATRGEWREAQGLEHRGESDNVHMVPVNLISMSAVEVQAPVDDVIDEPEPVDDEKEPVELLHKDVLPPGLDEVLQALDPRVLQDALEPIWVTNLEAWGNKVLEELGVEAFELALIDIELKQTIGSSFNMTDPNVIHFLDNWSTENIGGLVHNTTGRALQETLVDGVAVGEGIPQLSARITGVFSQARGFRSAMIARTEVSGAANFGTFTAHRQSGGIVNERQWVPTLDARTRPLHAAMRSHKLVGLTDRFMFGDGVKTLYPGASGKGHHDVNERCTTIAAIKGRRRTGEQLAALWKQFDRALIPWETAAIHAMQRAFSRQEREVIEAMKLYLVQNRGTNSNVIILG